MGMRKSVIGYSLGGNPTRALNVDKIKRCSYSYYLNRKSCP